MAASRACLHKSKVIRHLRETFLAASREAGEKRSNKALRWGAPQLS